MAVASSDLVIYVAANMPEDNTSTAGGAIDSGVRASFDDPSSAVQLKVYSADAADTSQTLTVTGRNAGGSIVSEGISLNGTTEVTSSNTYERILKTYLSATVMGQTKLQIFQLEKLDLEGHSMMQLHKLVLQKHTMKKFLLKIIMLQAL